MTRKRIYELAKELKISSKDLMELLQELGFSVKNHMTPLAKKKPGRSELLTRPEDDGGVDWVMTIPPQLL